VVDRAGHLPHRLSGGELQRVALARALINEPLVVLADEPTGNLDSEATNEILRLFGGLRDAQQTLVLVTHDPRVAATAERLLSMRDGVIVEDTRLDGGLPRQTLLAQLAGWEA
jgi:putative ABC transport system ATP-binding protein